MRKRAPLTHISDHPSTLGDTFETRKGEIPTCSFTSSFQVT